MSPSLYFPIFLYSCSLAAIIFGSHYLSSNDFSLQEKGYRNSFFAFLVCLVLIVWLGQRPIASSFGDTMGYALVYAKPDVKEVQMSWSSEWLWIWMMNMSKTMGFSVHTFFTIIEFGYIASIFVAVCILMPKNVLLGMLFVLVSFSFFTFGVNGLRNGLACHLMLLAMALYLTDQRALAVVFLLAAFGIHRSIALPVAAFIAGLFVIKDPKFSIFIWLASIPISFLAGYTFVNIFAGLGFDDRMEQYLSVSEGNALATSTSAFRWDFLLYSAMPVIMAWVVIINRKVTDTWYNVLVTTYCLSNAFWILVIRASFTNRFAYLSWVIYPIVIAYPLIMLPVWDDQDNKTGVILIAYTILTLAICYFTHML